MEYLVLFNQKNSGSKKFEAVLSCQMGWRTFVQFLKIQRLCYTWGHGVGFCSFS